jgi:multiple antibiotic resistance protein
MSFSGPLDAFLYALVALLVIIDPLGTAALFAALTPSDTNAERAEQAKRACVIGFVVLAAFGLAGQGLLAALGIGLPAMKAAGGVLLFLTAADMVSAKRALRASPEEREAATRTEEDISVFPLAIPLIAGPGAMTTMVLLHARAGASLLAQAAVEVALVAALIATLAGLLSARLISRLLGETGGNVVGRVLGVLLAALAAQFTIEGVREALGMG